MQIMGNTSNILLVLLFISTMLMLGSKIKPEKNPLYLLSSSFEVLTLFISFFYLAKQLNVEIFFILLLASGYAFLMFEKALSRFRDTDVIREHWLWQNVREALPIILVVFLFRSFAYEAFRIPSESLEPTLVVNDLVLVNKYIYGFRLPVINQKLLNVSAPRRGEIAVFHFPPEPNLYYIKRIIGVPGDDISYINKVLYINGQKMDQKEVSEAIDETLSWQYFPVIRLEEDLKTVKHHIHHRLNFPAHNIIHEKVPPGYYFVMGDNRDSSYDSRGWGFVPESNLVGRAEKILISWDETRFRFREDRIWKSIA